MPSARLRCQARFSPQQQAQLRHNGIITITVAGTTIIVAGTTIIVAGITIIVAGITIIVAGITIITTTVAGATTTGPAIASSAGVGELLRICEVWPAATAAGFFAGWLFGPAA
jgi:hypothetical protein